MKREKIEVARCTVERLMRQLGIQGVRRGKKIKTTHGQPADQCSLDRVNRQFRASQPNELWGEPCAPLVQAQWRATSRSSPPGVALSTWPS